MLEWLLMLVVFVALIGAAFWLLRGQFSGGGLAGSLFGAPRERRIGLSEQVAIDSRRKLVLVYRDGVEHLIMTGGPVDMVIEQNIQPQTNAQPRRHSYDRAAVVAEPQESGTVQPASFGRIRQRAGGSANADGQ